MTVRLASCFYSILASGAQTWCTEEALIAKHVVFRLTPVPGSRAVTVVDSQSQSDGVESKQTVQ